MTLRKAIAAVIGGNIYRAPEATWISPDPGRLVNAYR